MRSFVTKLTRVALVLGSAALAGCALDTEEEINVVPANPGEIAEDAEVHETEAAYEFQSSDTVQTVRFYTTPWTHSGSYVMTAPSGTTFCALIRNSLNINLRANANVYPSCSISIANGLWQLTASNTNDHAVVRCGMACY